MLPHVRYKSLNRSIKGSGKRYDLTHQHGEDAVNVTEMHYVHILASECTRKIKCRDDDKEDEEDDNVYVGEGVDEL